MAAPQPDNSLVVSHWAKLFEGIHVTPSELYDLIESCIKSREVADFQSSRLEWHEGGTFSDKRQYLRINRRDFDFYVCAAPYGSGFFVSSRLITPKGINWLLAIPLGLLCFLLIAFILLKVFGFFGILLAFASAIVGIILFLNANKLTFYKIDTGHMFQQVVHQSLMEAIDQMTKAAGIVPLSESERKPVMHELFR
ncbi:MAG: hypothetical protein WCD79_22455 [Chthoniobacteraceae bacterium]